MARISIQEANVRSVNLEPQKSKAIMDEKSRDENLKQHQQSKIVKGTVKKMFGEIPTDGRDAYKN